MKCATMSLSRFSNVAADDKYSLLTQYYKWSFDLYKRGVVAKVWTLPRKFSVPDPRRRKLSAHQHVHAKNGVQWGNILSRLMFSL